MEHHHLKTVPILPVTQSEWNLITFLFIQSIIKFKFSILDSWHEGFREIPEKLYIILR